MFHLLSNPRQLAMGKTRVSSSWTSFPSASIPGHRTHRSQSTQVILASEQSFSPVIERRGKLKPSCWQEESSRQETILAADRLSHWKPPLPLTSLSPPGGTQSKIILVGAINTKSGQKKIKQPFRQSCPLHLSLGSSNL